MSILHKKRSKEAIKIAKKGSSTLCCIWRGTSCIYPSSKGKMNYLEEFEVMITSDIWRQIVHHLDEANISFRRVHVMICHRQAAKVYSWNSFKK